MEPALVPGDHVVHGQAGLTPTAVLTRIIVATEDLTTGQLYVRSWPTYLHFKSDDGGPGDLQRNGSQIATAILNHRGFTAQDQYHCAPGRANVDWLEVRVEYKDGFVHYSPKISAIIAYRG